MRRVLVRGAIPMALLVWLPSVRVEAQQLIDAIRNQELAAIGPLLDRGADVRAATPDGAMLAFHLGDLETAARVLDGGADVSAANDCGLPPRRESQAVFQVM